MRISYWTGWLDPLMVAVSKEVFQLLRHYPGSRAFGISSHYWVTWSPANRSLGLHPRLYPLFRLLVPLLERQYDISHVYTALGDWHFLNVLGRRPIVLTLTERGEPADRRLLDKVAHIVAESEPLADTALQAGVSPERVSVIYPGVDLALYKSTAPPPRPPWKCLFASTPEREEGVVGRGVDLLLDLAAAEPDLEITMLWRPFGRGSDAAATKILERGLPNVRLRHGRVPNMQEMFGQYHFTVAPFRTVGKPCPNSILESLACGRPVLVSDYVDIGDLLTREGAGLVFPTTVEGIRAAYHGLCKNYERMQAAARPCAEKFFDFQDTLRAYDGVYERVLNNSLSATPA